MIFDRATGVQQVRELLHLYDGLQISIEEETQIVLIGSIVVHRTAKGFILCQEYEIKIVIPLYSWELPYVIDIGNSVDKNYPHRYSNGMLCLETDAIIRIRFVEGFSLSAWLSEYVETYYFSYEYYQRYREFPFGERSHGIEGIFETYAELFGEPDMLRTLKIMKSIVSDPYRGHLPCPCGSEKILRVCHGPQVMKYYLDDRLKVIVSNDYCSIMKEVQKYGEQQQYSE